MFEVRNDTQRCFEMKKFRPPLLQSVVKCSDNISKPYKKEFDFKYSGTISALFLFLGCLLVIILFHLQIEQPLNERSLRSSQLFINVCSLACQNCWDPATLHQHNWIYSRFSFSCLEDGTGNQIEIDIAILSSRYKQAEKTPIYTCFYGAARIEVVKYYLFNLARARF